MPVTDGFKLIGTFEYEDYDELEAITDSFPEKYGNGWWVTTYQDSIQIGEYSYPRRRLIRSRQPFGPYEVVTTAPQGDPWVLYGSSQPTEDLPPRVEWFGFEQGYWWVMVAVGSPTGDPSVPYRVTPELWYSQDLDNWYLAPVPAPETVQPCYYWPEAVQYHAGSGRYWVVMSISAGEPNGYYTDAVGPFADDPTNFRRGCIASATSPAGPWTLTYPGFGQTTNELSYGYGERHRSNDSYFEPFGFYLIPSRESQLNTNANYLGYTRSSGHNGGKCFKIEKVTEVIYSEFPWILYGSSYYSNPSYYYCYVLPYDLEKRFRTEYVMWHADNPTGPWTRTVLRALTREYNWVSLGCGSWSGTATDSLVSNLLPGPFELEAVSYPDYHYIYTDYFITLTAWGAGDWLIQTPSGGPYQYSNYYLEDRSFYRASGYPMDGPWTEYTLPTGTTDLGWAEYHDGYWVLLCKNTDVWNVKTWAGTDLSSLTAASLDGTPATLYANALPMWYAGDGQWLLMCSWDVDYYLAYPYWQPFSPGGAGWGTHLR